MAEGDSPFALAGTSSESWYEPTRTHLSVRPRHASSAPTSTCLAVFPRLNLNMTDTLTPLRTPYTVVWPPGGGDGEPEMTAAPRTLIEVSPDVAGTSVVGEGEDEDEGEDGGLSAAVGFGSGLTDVLRWSGASVSDPAATPTAAIAVPNKTSLDRPVLFGAEFGRTDVN